VTDCLIIYYLTIHYNIQSITLEAHYDIVTYRDLEMCDLTAF